MFRLVGAVSEDEAATMDVPQDKILKADTEAGTLEWF